MCLGVKWEKSQKWKWFGKISHRAATELVSSAWCVITTRGLGYFAADFNPLPGFGTTYKVAT